MRKIVDDPRLIYKCCYLYYKDGFSQVEICEQLGISRATVSRLLKAGRERNIVRIELENPDSVAYGDLERRLESEFDLKEIVIVDEMDVGNHYEHLQKVYKEAFAYFSRTFQDQEYIGVSMGRTLYNLVNANVDVEAVDCTFVPVVGGIGVKQADTQSFQSNEIASSFAKKFGARSVQFFAPAIFHDIAVMDGLKKEKSVEAVTALFPRLEAVITGIGSTDASYSTLVDSGYISSEQYDEYTNVGAVGDMILRFFDKNGNQEPFESFNNRLMAINESDLAKIDTRIAVVVGQDKAKAVLGALRGRLINVLITDISCIHRVLDIMEEEK